MRSKDTLVSETRLAEFVSRRSLADIERLLGSFGGKGFDAPNHLEILTKSLRNLENEGARTYLRNLGALMKEKGYGALERCVVEEMMRRGFSRESGEQRIFRSLVDDGLFEQVVSYGAEIAGHWEIRPDWSAAMGQAVSELVGGTEEGETLDAVLAVLDACGVACLRQVLEIEGCLSLLHAPLKTARALSDKHRLIWNYSVSVASVSHKELYLLERAGEADQATLYDDMLTFFMDESMTAKLALSLEIRDHPSIDEPATFDSGILLLLGFCCWLPERSLPTSLAAEFVRRDEALGTIRLMLDAMRRNGEVGRAYVHDLFDAVADARRMTLEVVGQRAEFGLLETAAEVETLLAQIREEGLPANRSYLVDLALGLMKNDQLELAARICEEESDCLLADATSARCVAQVYMAAKDWQRAAQTWDVLAGLSPSPHWPLANAYRAFARAADATAAAAIAAKMDLDDPGYLPTLPMLGHSACTIGDQAFALTVLEKAKAQIEVLTAEQRNLLAKVQTYALGDLSLFATPEEDLSASAAPSAIVIDPGFHYRSGHHFNYGKFSVDFLSRELGTAKESVWLLTGADKSERNDMSLEQNIKGVFRFNPYDYNYLAVTEGTIKTLNEAFYRDLLRIFRDIDLSKCKVIYLHSMKANMIVGFSRWLAKAFADRPITVVVGIIEVDYLLAPNAERALWSRANRRGINRLFSIPSVSPLLYCETQRAWLHFRKLTGNDLPVHQFPYLAASLAGQIKAPSERALAKESITFGTLGSSTPTRGSDLFPSLVQFFAPQKQVHWVLQLKRRYVESLGSDQVQFLEQAVRRGVCEWHDDRLSVEEYYDVMRRIDVMILPYRDRYAVSGSGVFYEAIQLERLLIVPQQTFMGNVVKEMKYPGHLIGEVSVEALARSMSRIVEKSESYKRRVAMFGEEGRERLPIERFRALFRRTLLTVPNT